MSSSLTSLPSYIFFVCPIADKNVLMKERMQLEKAKKNGKKSKTSVEKKNQNPGEHTTEGQRKEKKTQKKKDDKENEQKAKEREEKKKKKEEYKQRQEFLLETRKSQAAARWASTNSEVHPIPAAKFHGILSF